MSAYGDCVSSLRTSLVNLSLAVDHLGRGTVDYPRISSVLKTTRHYELIAQPSLAAAEASLSDEIGPFVSALLDRADRQLERRSRRIDTLKARADLNAGRLSSADLGLEGPDGPSYVKKRDKGKKIEAGGGRELKGEAALKAKIKRQRKEALRYGVERLKQEVAQKERELKARYCRA